MKLIAAILFVACVVSVPAWSRAAPGTPQFRLLDRIFAFAKTSPGAERAALDVLERVADARVHDAGPDLEAQVGLPPGELHAAAFESEPVRAYALSLIGEINLPEALSYLQNFKKSSAPVGGSMEVWPAAQVALRRALLNRMPDETTKVKFLEEALNERRDSSSNSTVKFWAFGELCNRGSLESLDLIRASVRQWNPTPRGERQIAFCQEQMEVISRDPDRMRALGSFLSISSGFADKELLGWAINQLAAMRSAPADAELKRFVNEVDSLPENSPLREHLRPAQHDALCANGQLIQWNPIHSSILMCPRVRTADWTPSNPTWWT